MSQIAYEKLSVLYSFTVTLRPNFYKYIAEVQYDKSYYKLYLHLTGNFGNHFNLVSELTKNYNIHYHGTIRFSVTGRHINVCKKFVDSFRRQELFGFVTIKQIVDDKGWLNYISKSLEEFKIEVGRPPVICDDLEEFKLVKEFDFDSMIQQDFSNDC